MSYNLTKNKREQIILKIVDILTKIDGIKTVKRNIPSVNDYISMPDTMCPYIGVISKLPKPVEIEYVKCLNEHIACEMVIEIWFFALDNDEPDSGISYWFDKLWQAIHLGIITSGLVESLMLLPESDTNIMNPNYAFYLSLKVLFVLQAGEEI